MATTSFISLRELATSWNDAVLIASDGQGILDRIGISSYDLKGSDDSIEASITLVFADEIGLSVPGVDGVGVYLGGQGATTEIDAVLTVFGSAGTAGYELRLADIDVILRFPSTMLRPVHDVDGRWEPTVAADGSDSPYELRLTSIGVTADNSGNVLLELADGATIPLAPAMIGDTGIVIEADGVGLYFSSELELPVGVPEGFKGLYLSTARVYLPDDLKDSIVDHVVFENAYIGSAGFTGSLTFSGAITTSVLDFALVLTDVQLSIVQNAIVEASLGGTLTIPYFGVQAKVTLSLATDGSMGVRLSETDANGVLAVPVGDVGTLDLTSVGLSVADDQAVLSLSGSLALTMAGLDWPECGIQELRIDSDGNVTIDGGWLTLQQPIALDLHGFWCEITRIGFGNEDDRRYIAFDCSVRLADALPTGLSVEGLKVLWDPTGEAAPELRFSGIGLELTIPGALHLVGEVAYEEATTQFKGEATLELLPLGLSLDASVLVGRNDEQGYNYVYVYLDVALPVGFPIFATGAAVYGFAGLYGMNVQPDASRLPGVENGDWYAWYKTGVDGGDEGAFSVTDADKWGGSDGSLALGAGLTVGTLFDGGWATSAKGLLVVLIPGPVIMLDAKADILKTPPTLSDTSAEGEGSLNALAVLDSNAGFLQLNIDVDWELAKVIDLSASAEAYFDFADATAWHLYIGQDEPEERRIQADVIALFTADAYFMLDNDGIAQGFGASLGDTWKFGPVKATLEAWIAADAAVSWRPPQLEGSLGLGGEIGISVAGFSTGISAEATLSGSTPTPFSVAGTLEITVNLPWPLKDLDAEAEFEWTKDDEPALFDPFESATAEHAKVTETWALSDDEADADAWPILPLDARPLLTFSKAVKDSAGIGSGTTDTDTTTSPGSDTIGDYSFEYELTSVTLERRARALEGMDWETPEGDSLEGEWAATDGSAWTAGGTRLQLLARTPFDFTRCSSRAYHDAYLAARPGWPCVEASEATASCIDWEDDEYATSYGPIFVKDGVTFCVSSAYLLSSDTPPTPPSVGVEESDHEGCTKELQIRADGLQGVFVWIAFPEPVRRVSLIVGSTWESAIEVFSGGERIEISPDEFVRVLPKGDPAANTCSSQVVEIEGDSIEWIKISTAGFDPRVCLCKVCWVTESDAATEDRTTAAQERQESRTEGWSSEESILEPEMDYRLTVGTRTTRTGGGQTTPPEEYEHTFYFRTAGAPGTTSAWDLPGEAGDDEDENMITSSDVYPGGGLLTDLSVYVADTIPADGNVVMKCAYALGCEFNETYVEQMCGADMVVRVTDVNDAPLTDAGGNELEFGNAWGNAPSVWLSDLEIAYVTALSGCADVEMSGFLSDATLMASTDALLEDEFAGSTGEWEEVTDGTVGTPATWAVSAGSLIETAAVNDGNADRTVPAKLGTMYLAGDEEWSDYSFEVHVRSDQGAIGAVVRCHGEGGERSYYRLSLDTTLGYRRFVRCVGGVFTTLWEDTGFDYAGRLTPIPVTGSLKSLPDAYTAEEDLLLVIQCQGTRLRAQLGNELLFDIEDADDAALLAGRCGLYTYNNATARFDYVLVQEWPGAYLDGKTQYNAELLASHVLFEESSRNGGWPVDADWATSAIGHVALAGLPTWDAYTVETNIAAGSDTVGVVLRWQGEDDHYRFLLKTDGSWTVDEVVAGNAVSRASGQVDSGTHSLSISAEGGALSVSIDSEQVAEFTSGGAPASGQFGLLRVNDADDVFGGFVVRSAPRSAVNSWSFVTSAYAGFVEQIDDFSSTVYTDLGLGEGIGEELRTNLLPAAATAMADGWAALQSARAELAAATDTTRQDKYDAVEAALTALNAVSAEQFTAVYAALLGDCDYRPLPPVGELNEVADADGRCAILLESPEPLEWTRIITTLEVDGGGAFETVADPLLVWSEDGTRAVLARNDAADGLFADGTYRLQLAFQLDVGSEAPVLLRGKSSAPELAVIEFALGGA